jgi:seryl-tRNA synthetase
MQLEDILANNRQEVDKEYSDTVKTLEEVNDKMKNKLQKYRAVNRKRTTLVQQLQQTNASLEERKTELLEENSTLQSKLQESQFQSNLNITGTQFLHFSQLTQIRINREKQFP